MAGWRQLTWPFFPAFNINLASQCLNIDSDREKS
jgi:hypothetical protein